VIGLAFAKLVAMICVLVFCIETFSLFGREGFSIPDLVARTR
jgi:hypothetical protein